MAAEGRRNRNEQTKEALVPRPRFDRYICKGLASTDPDDRAGVGGGA